MMLVGVARWPKLVVTDGLPVLNLRLSAAAGLASATHGLILLLELGQAMQSLCLAGQEVLSSVRRCPQL